MQGKVTAVPCEVQVVTVPTACNELSIKRLTDNYRSAKVPSEKCQFHRIICLRLTIRMNTLRKDFIY